MPTSAQMRNRDKRVINILQSINEGIGSSGALELLGEDGTRSVPLGLRKAIARTAIFMLDEARKPLPKPKRDPDEYRAELAAKKDKANLKKRGAAREGAWRKANPGQEPSDKDLAKFADAPKAQDVAKKKAEPHRRIKKILKKSKLPRDTTPEPEDKFLDINKKPLVKGARLARAIKGGKTIKGIGKKAQRGLGKRKAPPEALAALARGGVRRAKGFQKARPGTNVGRRDAPEPLVRKGPGEVRPRQQDADKSSGLDALEKDRQRRTGKILKKAGKLTRMRYQDPHLRDRDLDRTKGYDPHHKQDRVHARFAALHMRAARGDEEAQHQIDDMIRRGMGRIKAHPDDEDHPALQRSSRPSGGGGGDPADSIRPSEKDDHHIDASGNKVHGSGNKANKKFANRTTFGNSDDDAMLHTDNAKEGSRGNADDDEFADKDPRQKWYRVSKEGGYASAMASLGKSYNKTPAMRSKVVSKVKSTGFVDRSGHQINVKPTGAMHNERPACFKRKSGRLTQQGKILKRHDPSEFYRLCKGSHDGEGGTKKGRSEYTRGFDPRHDDSSKQHRLHKAAESGKAEEPHANIAQHLGVKPGRRRDVEGAGHSIDRKAVRTMREMGKKRRQG